MASKLFVDEIESATESSDITITGNVVGGMNLSSGKSIKNAAGTALLTEAGVLGSSVVFPAGHVIQFVSESIDTQSQTTMTNGDTYYTITACTAAITPHVTGSKILVTIFANISDSSGTGSDTFSGAGIIRTGPSTASSPLGVAAGTSMRGGWIRYTEDDGDNATYPVMVSWEDTAQDDSTSHVYTLQFKSVASGHTASLNRRYGNMAYSGVSTVTLMEIAV